MKKRFNTTGTCIPERHYMVDISNKIDQIMEIIEYGEYFTINRPRQYGKTTTMFMIENYLKTRDDYFVLFISFEGIGDDVFRNEEQFVNAFIRQLKKEYILSKQEKYREFIESYAKIKTIEELSVFITDLCMLDENKIVLMIDEVDKSSNNQLFLSFIGMLRNKYLARDMKKDFTFQSVILAGVYDVKSLKLKLRPGEEEKYNSPWNIAVDFDVDMSFNPQEIATMLKDYSEDRDVKMDIAELSERIHYYTSGHPFLVSKICQIIDEKIKPGNEWTLNEIDEAVKRILWLKSVNFDSLIKNLENYKELYDLVYDIIKAMVVMAKFALKTLHCLNISSLQSLGN